MNAAARGGGSAAALLALALAAWPPASQGAFVRVNCRGIQEFSTSKSRAACEESSVLEDDAHLMLGHTRAQASLPEARLSSSAAGGQIRGAGSNGGDSAALLKDRLTIVGDWQGSVAVTVRLCVAYTFAGFGESRVRAALHGASGDSADYANQARVRIVHRGFVGAALEHGQSRGEFAIPASGPRESQSVFVVSVIQRVHRSRPVVSLRADLAAHALPNLEPLEPVLSSFAEAHAWMQVSLPGGLAFSSQSGVFMSDPIGRRDPRPRPAANPAWGIIAASEKGSEHALRDHRYRHRAAARSDCRQQLGVDG